MLTSFSQNHESMRMTAQRVCTYSSFVAGLGFDDCSAPLNDLAATTPGTATDQPSGKWAFWRIQISAATFEYVLSANTAKASNSSLQLFMAREKLPGSSPGWHELSSCIMEWADTQQTSLRLRSGDEHYAPGKCSEHRIAFSPASTCCLAESQCCCLFLVAR